MSKEIDEHSLAGGWKAFAANLHRLGVHTRAVRARVRQVKNGAACIWARGTTRRRDALHEFFLNEVHAAQLLYGFAGICRRAHPDWGDLHDDAVFVGGWAALVLHHTENWTLDRLSIEVDGFDGVVLAE
jgi:hypothetical protein